MRLSAWTVSTDEDSSARAGTESRAVLLGGYRRSYQAAGEFRGWNFERLAGASIVSRCNTRAVRHVRDCMTALEITTRLHSTVYGDEMGELKLGSRKWAWKI